MRLSLHFLGILLLSLVCLSAGAESQRKLTSYQKYISKYSDLAIQHQKKYRIPASITLAQGLLESGAGQSDLARRSNNHFGIKCHSDWRGGRVYHDDDLRGECFRKYKNPEQSYEDHARFLVDRPRYARLFKLKVTDYKGWARGLQKCGYATDRAYANRLRRLVYSALFLALALLLPCAACGSTPAWWTCLPLSSMWTTPSRTPPTTAGC